MSEQPALRQLPQISSDGASVTAEGLNYSAGEILSQRHGGTDVLYGFSAAEVLAACTPLPERLLLGYARQTEEDRRKSAIAGALAHAFVALLPALLIMAGLRHITDNRPVTLAGFILIMLGVMARAAWRELRTPGKVWQLTEWLDFSTRTWHARKAFGKVAGPPQDFPDPHGGRLDPEGASRGLTSPDGSLPTRNASLPLDQLLLVCIDQHWEQGVTYDIALCRANEFEGLEKYSEAPRLNMLHQAETEEESLAFARQLSALWQIPARRYAFDVTAQRNRLFELDEGPPNQRRRKKSVP
ncbi:hypothetical protein Q9Q94_13450 [Uliginosibacterium sp. 31-16]|uniref:hypothetical protein n=1 Tax=Uliginosibacterium sp. 31-16 TaxID=3068315 RepID=UPI00273D55A8|nr:hypothetical protein [Uliginosibacterium sp. 31-16]MDP5240544.1 hypothetical protein [Uliginosibacterium sp. 31-16]